jgi:hypothetical protein
VEGTGVTTCLGVVAVNVRPDRALTLGVGSATAAGPNAGGVLLWRGSPLPMIGSAIRGTHGARAKLAPTSTR